MKQLTQSEIRKNGKVYKNVSSPATEGTTKQVTDIVEKDGTFSISTDGGKTYSPAVPEAITESVVSGWGFTKNKGTVTSVAVKMNGTTKGTVTNSGTIDLGTVITSHQDISGKQDKLTPGDNISIVSNTISVTGLGNVENKTMDTAPTANSENYVTSGGVKTYIDNAIAAVEQFQYEVVSVLPAASADTMGKIYLVADKHSSTDNYDEFITLDNKGAYVWEKIGNTDIDLSGYVKNTTTIAGVDFKDNITKTELLTALNVADGATKVNEATVTGWGFLTKNNIVAGDNVTVTDENGNVKISATGGGSGGVTYTKLTGSVDFTTTAYTDDPYFLDQNAATWSENSAVGNKALTSTTDIGLFIGTSYTMVVNIQGTSSMFSAKAEDGSSYGLRGSKVLWFKRDDIPSQFFIYDHCTIVGGNIQAGNGCIFIADLGSDITIAAINYFSGNRGVITPVTITNSAIKINSAVTMYINSSLVVSGTKTDGSITLTASTEGSVSYEMEILNTSTEGLLEVINTYVPDVPTKTSQLENDSNFATTLDIPTNTSQLTNDSGFITAADIPGVGEWVSVTGESTTLTQAGTYQFVTTVDKAQSIMYWDGTTAAIGTPMVGLIVNADLPEVITITPRVDADGRLTIHQSRLVKENDAWVVKGSAISSGFKYRKIN